MKRLRVLYIGDQAPHTTSFHRCEALRRLGHEVIAINPKDSLSFNRLERIFHYRTGYRFVVGKVMRSILGVLTGRFDVAWIDNGELCSAELLRALRMRASHLVNYNCDDPTGLRDRGRWGTWREALPQYDLCVAVRVSGANEYPAFGARRVFRVWMSADEVAHAPRHITTPIRQRWASDVAFVGTWMPERGPFLQRLARAGLPLAIWGDRWARAPEWQSLRPFWRGGALWGDDYAYAIQCARVSLGLLSKGNRDLHTTRSAEIPALGGLLLAEDTFEHRQSYVHGEEAFFWRNPDECIMLAKRLLSDVELRNRVADAGRARWLASPLRNEFVIKTVLSKLLFVEKLPLVESSSSTSAQNILPK